MQSSAPNVAKYVSEQPLARQAILKRLRRLCREHLKGYEEGMEYGMPAYKRAGAVEVAFASQKQYVALYVLTKDVVDRHRPLLTGCSIGKGCIRFPRPGKIDFDQIAALLSSVAQSKEKPC